MFQRTVFNDEQNYFRETVAKFVSKEVLPHHSLWEKEGIVPKEIWLKAGFRNPLSKYTERIWWYRW